VYGVLLLTLGFLGEVFFSLRMPVGAVMSAVLAVVGVFLLVMAFGGLRKVKPLQARDWEIYPLITIVLMALSPLTYSLLLQNLLIGLKICSFVFVVHAFYLLAIFCRKKYAYKRRY